MPNAELDSDIPSGKLVYLWDIDMQDIRIPSRPALTFDPPVTPVGKRPT
jgi:hypothetical protein